MEKGSGREEEREEREREKKVVDGKDEGETIFDGERERERDATTTGIPRYLLSYIGIYRV